MTDIQAEMPSDVFYGKVIGRFLKAVADASDEDRLPDAVAATGNVTFTPVVANFKAAVPEPTTIVRVPIRCSVDDTGHLIDPQGNRGVWLVAGAYRVTYTLAEATIDTHNIFVTVDNTDGAPVDLTNALPVGTPVTPTQYAELSARIDNLFGAIPDVPVASVNNKTGFVTLSATDVDTYTIDEINQNFITSPQLQAALAALPPPIQPPVTSVNNKLGAVNLTAADVGALTQEQADAKYATQSSVGARALDDLTDVDLTGAIDGQALFRVAGVWKARAAASGNTLLLENGSAVPANTPIGSIVFEKAPLPKDFDFTQGALPSGWNKFAGTTETFDGTGMTATFDNLEGYYYDGIGPMPDNCLFEIEMVTHSALSSNIMIGPALLTSASNNGVGATWYQGSNGLLAIGISGRQYNNAAVTVAKGLFVPVRMRIRRAGGAFYASVSQDNGASWTETPNYNSNLVPDRLSILQSMGGQVVNKIKSARYIAGMATGSPKGWWDGTKLQPLA